MNVRNLLKIKIFTPPVLLALAACSAYVENPLADGPVPLGVKAEIGQVMSRATSAGFDADDVIGVVPVKGGTAQTDGSGIAYAMGAEGFAPVSDPYYFTDAQTVTFNAYYPQRALPDGQTTIALDTRATQQGTETLGNGVTWCRNDFLAASATATAFSSTANYTGDHAFRHVMTQLVLTFKAGAGLADLSALSSYTLTTPLAMDGTFTPATGLAVADETKTKETLTMNSLTTEADGTKSSTLLLLPQAVADGKLVLDVTYDGQTYRAALSIPKPEGAAEDATPAFLAGTSYTYAVTIKQNELSVGQAEIKEWNKETVTADATLVPPIGNKVVEEAANGDYYLKDGSLADGTLPLTPEQADACIGIVFAVGVEENDNDYTETGIGQEKCHGYVVALTDAHLDGEKLAWAALEEEKGNISNFPGTPTDWRGYAKTQAIRDYAEKKYGTEASKYFPAAYACLQYGTAEDPDWARRFAAPSSSSGWFLPSVGQLWGLLNFKVVISSSFANLKGAFSEGVPVGWLSENDYWSSVLFGVDDAKSVTVSTGYDPSTIKSTKLPVRPILAF